jgi:acylglycerol lipase
MSAIAGSVDPILERVHAKDGTDIHTRRWPAVGAAWSGFVIVHGLGEHSGRYEHVGSHLAEAGIDTIALDLRGFGLSGGDRAWVDRWSQLHDDVEERLVSIRAAAPGRPLVLYGHSLGGLIVLGYLLDGRSLPEAAVLSAPAIRATLPAVQRIAVNVLGRIAPKARVANGIPTAALSSSRAVQDDYVSDPLNVHESCVGFGLRAFNEQARVAAALDRLAVPTLVIHGARDTLVPTASSEVLMGRPRVTRRVYDAAHELHNEPIADVVLGDLVTWVREQVGPKA